MKIGKALLVFSLPYIDLFSQVITRSIFKFGDQSEDFTFE